MTSDLLRAAAAHFTAGRLADAANLARLVLAADPRSRDALRILASVHAQQGQPAQAAELFARLVENDPKDAESLHNLGLLLTGLGRAEEAAAHLGTAVRIRKNWPEAHASLAAALRRLGRLADAAAHLEKAIRLRPGAAAFHTDLGVIRLSRGQAAAAVESFRKAVRFAPGDAEALANLGTALRQLGRREEAAESFREATRTKPGFIEAHVGLADTLLDLGRFAGAAAAYRRSLAIRPDVFEALNHYGAGLLATGDADGAERHFARAIAARPDDARPYVNLGLIRLDRRRLQSAGATLHRAAALTPADVDALNILGLVDQASGRLNSALAFHRRVLHIDPAHAVAHSNVIFLLDHLPGGSFEEHQAERRRWYLRHARAHAASIRSHANVPDPDRKLRIGYVSADFRQHSAAMLFGPILDRIDRTQFATICYSGVVVEDDRTRAFRAVADLWRPTTGLRAEDIAEQVRADGIDILVDLSGYSAGHQLLVFARKPAPVQVTGWGYSTGTGLPTIDYFLADPVYVPADVRPLFAETIYDLPCFIPFQPYADAPPVGSARRAAGSAVTFGCFNRRVKVTDDALAAWARLLAATPTARLLLKDSAFDDPEVCRRMRATLGGHGVDPGRIEMRGRTGRTEHLVAMSEVDISLDTFPQNGGLTTYESILMGVPVVALAGRAAPGRGGAAILTALGLPDWIADDVDAYVAIGTAAAADPGRIATLRATLRQRLLDSEVGNLDRYTRAAEAAFRDIWRRWCATRPAGRRRG